jgi:hypothetical protein
MDGIYRLSGGIGYRLEDQVVRRYVLVSIQMLFKS